ncbi:MAG: FtsQ-type POTRA domain-containing protein [Thermodesulfobacteriota bacterium]
MRKSSYSNGLKRTMTGRGQNVQLLLRLLTLLVLGGAGLGLLVWLFMLWAGNSVFFQVESVQVRGSKQFTEAEVVAMAGLDIRSNLVAARKGDMRDRLRASGWIAQVDINKNWPDQIIITVKERQPLAMVKVAGSPLSYLDRRGVSFATVGRDDELDFPVITLVSHDLLGDRQALKDVLDLLRYAGGGNVGLPRQNISQMVLAEDGDLTIYLADNPCPIHLGQGRMWKKYKQLTRVLTWLYKKKRFAAVQEIDMEYQEGRVLVRFTG